MSYNLLFQHEALIEIQEAFEWYESRKSGLGFELINELERCYERIAVTPQHYFSINGIYRRIVLRRFPFMLIYEVDGENVIVISLHHFKQDRQ